MEIVYMCIIFIMYTYVHTCNIIFLNHKRNEIVTFIGKWMKVEVVVLSEISHVQKDKDHVSSHIWKMDPNDKCIHRYNHDHTTYMERHFSNGGTV
jgi:hypothetical protein